MRAMGRGMMTEAKIRAAKKLCTPMNPKYVEVKTSTIEGAGDGVFVKCDVAKGQVISLYPGAKVPTKIMKHMATESIEMVAKGERTPEEHERMYQYVVGFGKPISTVGDGSIRDPTIGVAHLCNDAGVVGDLRSLIEELYHAETKSQARVATARIMMWAAEYDASSIVRANASLADDPSGNDCVRATEDIPAGGEVLVRYGSTYWLNKAIRQTLNRGFSRIDLTKEGVKKCHENLEMTSRVITAINTRVNEGKISKEELARLYTEIIAVLMTDE